MIQESGFGTEILTGLDLVNAQHCAAMMNCMSIFLVFTRKSISFDVLLPELTQFTDR